jgi:hypothetical protein
MKDNPDGISGQITETEEEFIKVKNELIKDIIYELDEIIDRTESGEYPTFVQHISSEKEFKTFVEMMAMNHFNALAEEKKVIKDLKVLLNMHMWNEWIKWSSIRYFNDKE